MVEFSVVIIKPKKCDFAFVNKNSKIYFAFNKITINR